MKKRLLKDMNVTIIGIGLMGGSILKALKDNSNAPKNIIAFDINEDILKKVERQNLANIATDDANIALKNADLVVVSLYPSISIEFIKNNVNLFKENCIITDICGTKREIMDVVPKILPDNIHFVGGHPMAGREHKGFDYSIPELFVGCKYILDEAGIEGKDVVIEFAKALGAGNIIYSNGSNHDELIAYTSQLPHVLSVAYMICAKDRNVEEFSAGSFRDITRVAMINDEMWSEIFVENSDMLLSEISCLKEGISKIEQYIKNGEKEKLRQEMRKASAMRENIKE